MRARNSVGPYNGIGQLISVQASKDESIGTEKLSWDISKSEFKRMYTQRLYSQSCPNAHVHQNKSLTALPFDRGSMQTKGLHAHYHLVGAPCDMQTTIW